ncbi:MAG: class I SAM-dependent methyltransferase [Pirellulales bacterium]
MYWSQRRCLAHGPFTPSLLTTMLFAVACVEVLCVDVRAEPPEAAANEDLPPPRQVYLGRRIAPFMSYLGADWLVREQRSREENSELLLKALGVTKGATVCDLGCGNGYYTLELAKLVGPTGRVLAVDIQPEMLELLRQRTESRGVVNVQPVLGTVADPKLPAGELDLVLLVDVYHEFSYPELMLRAIRRSLKPDGRIVLVEFREEDPTVPIRPLHKMSKQQVEKELTANGYQLVEAFDDLPWQHVLFYGRDEKSGGASGEDASARPE